MPGFKTFRHGRFYVHILTTRQFKTTHLNIKLVRPLGREAVTAHALLPYLWMEGTKRFPSAELLMRHADDLFGTLLRTTVNKRGDRQVLECYASFPEESAIGSASGLGQNVINLLFGLITEPEVEDSSFPRQHVERELGLHTNRLKSLYDDKVSYAFERCMEAVCRGEVPGIARLGYLEDLDALTGSTLWQYHQELIASAQVHVYLVGNFANELKTVDEVWAALGRLPERTTVTDAAAPIVRALKRTSLEAVSVEERQAVQQGKLDLGFRTGISYASSDYPALLVCNGILGGFPHSKLFMNVRERESLAYYASSRLDALNGIITIQTGIDIAKHDQALQTILQQLENLQKGSVTNDELELTKRSLRNQYLQVMDQPSSMIDFHFGSGLAGEPREIETQLARLEVVTIDDVVRAAEEIRLDAIYFLRDSKEDPNA